MAVLIRIDDPNDERIAAFRVRDRSLNTRADRRERVAAGLFVAEGDLVVSRALDAGCECVAALADSAATPDVVHRLGPDVDVYVGDENVRRVGMGLGVPLSIVALFRRPGLVDPEVLISAHRVVAVEAVDNPVNIGTIVRSASALGWTGLLLDRTSADPLARRALRVAMGNAFALPFARVDSLGTTIERAQRAGTMVVGLTPRAGAVTLDAVRPTTDQAVMLVLGSERSGLTADILELCSLTACIPMAAGVDSLNAAAAAAIACYALSAGSSRS